MKITVSFLDELEKQIRLNEAPSLRGLTAIRSKDLPRALVGRYANLLRRMGGAKYALKLLNPIVRKKTGHANNNEIIEYAACLTRLSLFDESIDLLHTIKNESSPEIYFELAMAHVFKWEYPAARIFFEKYLLSPGLSEYKRCVGEINLAAGFIYLGDISAASQALDNVVAKAKKEEFHMLCGNALELLGEIAILKKDYAGAENYLKEASSLLGSSNPRYVLYLEKWRAIRRVLQENGSPKSIQDLLPVRNQAAKIRDWNTLREIELFKSMATDDLQGITDLYYSVPYPEYRKRILALWKKPFRINESYDKKIGPHPTREGKIFDIAKGRDLKSGRGLRVGHATHRLLECLTSDFYAPFSTTRIYSSVFKDAFFNPETSPQQVYEVIKRLNLWFSKNDLDLQILRGQGGYRLRSKEGYILRISESPQNRTRLNDFLENLSEHNLIENFSVSMVEENLDLPRRTATRMLAEATDLGWLTRSGGGHSTRYSQTNLRKVS